MRGLQDPSFFMYHEDHDLGLRAGQLGHRMLAVPQGLCHHGRGTPGLSLRATSGYSPKRIAYMIANRWRILLTRYELRTLVLLSPALVLFELAQLVGSVAKGWGRSWLAAVGRILHDLPHIARERHAWAAQRRFRRRTGARGWAPALPPQAPVRQPGADGGTLRLGRRVAQLADGAAPPARCPGLAEVSADQAARTNGTGR